MEDQDTLGILKQLERGDISASEADARLSAPATVEHTETPQIEKFEAPAWVHRIWVYALIAGVVIVLFGTWIIAATVHANILWLLFGVPIVLLGSLLLAIAATMYSGHWIYVNIEQSRRRHRTIRFGIPFSMDLLRFGLWIAQKTMPEPHARVNVQASRIKFDALWQDPEEFFATLARELKEGHGITVDVEDRGERVQVFIV